jgi:glycosyltransferase involved in cell wall biosynthesis
MRVMARRLAVLMVTGAYYPELSGGGLQARAIVHALRPSVTFSVLTTSTDRSLPRRAEDDGVIVERVYVDPDRVASRIAAGFRLLWSFARMAGRADVVNVHGFSKKMILLVAISRALGKPLALTLQTGGHDEPNGVRALGRAAYWAFCRADLYLSVSPGLSRAYLAAHLPPSRLRQVCNAVDTDRFRPAAPGERDALRRELRLPCDEPLVLFVGYFGRDKRPDLLYEAWAESGVASALVLVGATRPSYREVDPALAEAIRHRAERDGRLERLFFVEQSRAIDKYFRAADVYVLPSVREGLPIALLEAMACGLPCIATRLPGSTDVIIEDGTTGVLLPPDAPHEFAAAIARLLEDPLLAARLGDGARRAVEERYSIQGTSAAWYDAYCELAARRESPVETAHS